MLELPLFRTAANRAIVICLSFAVFVTYKFNDIFLPYFWDEMAGYMSGVIYMLDHKISILPSAIPAESSYGHPLLVHFIMACVAKVFGSSVAVMHVTTLVFTFFLAWGTYLLAYFLSKNYSLAIGAFILCLAQPIVIAQSTQVLLEVFLAMTFVYAVYFYCREHYTFSVLFCVMAVLTKETGIVMAIAFIVQHSLQLVLDKDVKKWMRLNMMYLLPFVVFGAFILIQKQTYGWYLNPVNVGKTKLALGSMIQKIWDYPLEFTFVNQGRFALSLVMLGAIILFFIRDFKSSKWHFNRPLMLIGIFSFGFIVFSSIADTLERYFLALIPFAVIGFASCIWYFRRIHTYLPVFLFLICVSVNLWYIDNGEKYADADMSYRHLVKTNQMVFDYVNSGRFQNDTIGFAFPMMYAPLDTRYGYFKEKRFVADTGFTKKSKYFIYCSPGNIDWNPPDNHQLIPIMEFRSGYSKAFIYKKINF